MAALYNGELERRVALLRRLKELLLEQRGKFERYLEVLDHEKTDIESGDLEKLNAHVEIEEAIVSEIFTFQRSIDPLEELYRSALSAGSYRAADTADGLPAIKGALAELTTEVQKRSAENRSLLKRRMELVRSELLNIRRPLQGRSSVYAGQGEGGLVDISG